MGNSLHTNIKVEDHNMLVDWYEKTPFRAEHPEWTELVFNSLNLFFGRTFFDVKGGNDLPIHKISWIFSLLANYDKKGCLFALLDISMTIAYLTKRLSPALQKEGEDLLKNHEKMRAFFYELFIYRILDANQLHNVKAPMVGKQQVEGICRIEGIDHLFECRKLYLNNLLELDVKRRLMVQLAMVGGKMKYARRMICTFTFEGTVTGAHLHGFTNQFKEFMAEYNRHSETTLLIDYHRQSAIGKFDAINFSNEKFEEIKAAKDYDIVCYTDEPKPTDTGLLYSRLRVDANFEVPHRKIYERLEAAFKEKRKQHIDSPFTNKVFFFDSEKLPEFQMGLFQQDGMYDLDSIKEVYKKAGMTEIVCITRREYFDEGPSIAVDVITPNDLIGIGSKVKRLFDVMFGKNA